MAEKYDEHYDGLGLIEEGMLKKEIDEVHDYWDDYYGEHPYSYETYVLVDSTKPGEYKFGDLTFNYEPFYVGHGKIGRHKKSGSLARQLDKYNFKIKRMIKINNNGGCIRAVIVGRYQTKVKANLVERKLMNTIPKQYLTNSLLHLCEVPLKKEDCNCMCQSGVLTL